jgi:hypothetical protein
VPGRRPLPLPLLLALPFCADAAMHDTLRQEPATNGGKGFQGLSCSSPLPEEPHAAAMHAAACVQCQLLA